MTSKHSRRLFLARSAAVAGTFAIPSNLVLAQELTPTPECKDGDEATLRQTEGPFFKPSSPQRADMTDGVSGDTFRLFGLVLTRECRPVAGALVDLWHADDKGQYDENGFRCRGHQYTDAQGRYRFTTVRPGLYSGRTRHFHVKVQAPTRPILTTQLYFPDEPANRRDGLYRRELLMRVAEREGQKAGRFDFVLDLR